MSSSIGTLAGVNQSVSPRQTIHPQPVAKNTAQDSDGDNDGSANAVKSSSVNLAGCGRLVDTHE